jgi:hypothetical protein
MVRAELYRPIKSDRWDGQVDHVANRPVGPLVGDNGEPGTADKLNFSRGSQADPGCGQNPDAEPVFTIVDGNYQGFDTP